MKRSLIVFTCLLLSMSACSDFKNSSSGSDRAAPPGPQKPLGKNPFPAGFDANAGAFSNAKMLANIGLNVIAPAVTAFRLQSELLQNELEQACKAETVQVDDPRRQWKRTMLAFDRVAALPVGPIADRGGFYSDNLYSWPNLDVCGIDRIVARYAQDASFPKAILHTRKGLAAIEYLLFEPSLNTACPASDADFALVATWATRDADKKTKDRCQVAQRMSEEVTALAKSLEENWDPNNGNFSKSLHDGQGFDEGVKGAFNAMSHALFSLEHSKDDRIGKPTGLIRRECASGKCPEMAEHAWSGLAIESLAVRVNAFVDAFRGQTGFGFDDALAQDPPRRQDVSDRVLNLASKVQSSIAILKTKGTLQKQIADMSPTLCQSSNSDSRLVEVCALYDDMKALIRLLKVEFLSALSLSAPPTHSGDAD